MSDAQNLYLTVASGQTVSNYASLANVDGIGSIWMPAVTSCQAYLQGSFDTTSANFFRLQNILATSTFVMNAADGSKVFPVLAANVSVPYIRIETSVAQADTRSCVAMTRV